MVEDLKRFFVSLALTIPILLLISDVQMFMGFNWGFPGMPICYLFYPQCFLFMEEALYYGARGGIKGKVPAMSDHITLAILPMYL